MLFCLIAMPFEGGSFANNLFNTLGKGIQSADEQSRIDKRD